MASANPNQPNPSAAILVIGDEILQGETQDTNSAFLCRELSARGVDVWRIVTVPDEPAAIAAELLRLRELGCDHILTCGGIGPTPDDVTRQAIADALGQPLVLSQAAAARYERLRGGSLNKAQLEMCRLPRDAEPVFGTGTGAPGFSVGNVLALPGVPEILREMWEVVASRYAGTPLHVERFTAGRRESQFAALMAEYAARYPELKFGSYPHRITGGWEVELRVRGSSAAQVRDVAGHFAAAIAALPE